MTALPSVGPPQLATLSPRLDALAELVRIGRDRDGFSPELLEESDELLRRAGERLRLSANHTVVALAGGTGSGKSTLFNTLAGATFSPSGVTRPTTRHVHACVWGMQGAGPLLDWLGVQRRHRYTRASALDSGEAALNGLLLLDLPDHDSVVTASLAAVDRLSKLADMLVWVLDPQKYADASVHNRYLIPLAGHASVFTVVLNQIDLLDERQRADCEDDLRRLLDSEGLADTPLVSVSARTGEGLDDLRALLVRQVSDRQVAGARIAADIDAIIGGYAGHAAGPALPEDAAVAPPVPAPVPGDALAAELDADLDSGEAERTPSRPPWEFSDAELAEMAAQRRKPPWADAAPGEPPREQDNAILARNIPAGPAAELTAAFGAAAGVSATAETMASAREAKAARYTGWPLARLAGRGGGAGRGSLSGGSLSGGSLGGGSLGGGARAAGGGSALGSPALGGGALGGGGDEGLSGGAAQQADVNNAITAFADAVSAKLPAPWPSTVRTAARSRFAEVPAALAAAGGAVPRAPGAPAWWRLIAVWQWLLTVLAAAAVVWVIVIAAGHAGHQKSTLLGDVSLIPWLVVIAAAVLLLGWLTASGCRNVAVLAADRERTRAEEAMREQVATVARDLVLAPTGHEIAEYERFRRELAIAHGH